MTVLAAFAIDDILGLPARAALTRMVLAVGILFACVAIPFQQNAAGLVDKDTPGSYSAWFATSIEIAALTIALLVVASFCKDAVRRTIAIGIIVGVQIVGYYALPSLSYPRDGRIELGSVGYLRAHLGLQRFYSLGPLAPNYGSYYARTQLPEHFGRDTACNRLRRGALLSHASRASYVNRQHRHAVGFYRSTASRGRLESRLRYNVYLARFHSFYGNTAAGLKTNHHWHKMGTCSRVNRSASRSSLIRRSPTFGSSTVMSYPRSTNCRTPHHTIRLQTACYRTKGAFTLRRLVGRQVRSGALSYLWTGGPSASMDPRNRCH